VLSPGKWLAPKDLDENLRYRQWLIQACDDNPEFRRVVVKMCRDDIRFWINSFVWQFNPSAVGQEVGPFITWDFQDEAIADLLEAVEAREDVRWQKSREMGASWLVLLVLDWLGTFHEHKKVLCLSRDEDAVDRADDSDSLFWKLDFVHKWSPPWLTGPIKRKKLLFKYERTQSICSGEANTIVAGVGGRGTILLVDEFGTFKNGFETYSLTSDTSHCRVFVGTHKDAVSMFYNLCFDAKFAGMREILTHWSQHPDKKQGAYRYNDDTGQVEIIDKTFKYAKDFKFMMEAKPTGGPFPGLRSPWYDKECIRRTDRDVAMNLDIDPRGATDRFFDGYRIQVLKQQFAVEPFWRGNLKYDKETGVPHELVEDPQGFIKLWCHPKSETLLPSIRGAAGVDVSAGAGNTPSCLCLGDARTGEKLLEYSNANIYATDFAVFCVAVCQLFKDEHGEPPLMCWEIQGSPAFARKVQELGYFNVYWRRDEDALGKPLDNKGRAGFNAQPRAILALMEEYRAGLYEQRCVNRSAFALDECLNFVYTTSGVEYKGRKKPGVADDGSGAKIHHGDVVRADAIMYKMMKHLGPGEPKDPWAADPKWISPATLEGRMKLFALEQEEELIWF
jgi:hypothetical protein